LPGNKKSVLLISYGSPAQECLKAQEKNPEVGVLVFNKLKPIDTSVLKNILIQYETFIVIEDHFASSGLLGLLSEFCILNQIYKKTISLAPNDYIFDVGRANSFFHKKIGIDAESISTKINSL
jgi:deoxyxylulose-5-phosphate synthase